MTEFEQLMSEDAVAAAYKRLDAKAYQEALSIILANYSVVLHFNAHYKSLHYLKSRFNNLPQRNEQKLAEQAQEAAEAYEEMLGQLEKAGELLSESGLGKFFEENAAGIFGDARDNPHLQPVFHTFRQIGANEAQIHQVLGAVQQHDWNPFLVSGGGGSYEGLLKGAHRELGTLQERARILKENGVPLAEGAGSVGAVVTAVVVAVVIVGCVAAIVVPALGITCVLVVAAV